MTKHQNWFQSWFNTKYYHILYKQRNYEEAERFLKNLITFLNINKNHTILDLACGKGRHSIFLNSLGYDVTGVDLSEQSIKKASQSSNDRLKFMIHDMRYPIESNYDVILNMFTSFGYFDSIDDNFNVLKTIKNSLNKDGIGVIDFMNSRVVDQSALQAIEDLAKKYKKRKKTLQLKHLSSDCHKLLRKAGQLVVNSDDDPHYGIAVNYSVRTGSFGNA